MTTTNAYLGIALLFSLSAGQLASTTPAPTPDRKDLRVSERAVAEARRQDRTPAPSEAEISRSADPDRTLINRDLIDRQTRHEVRAVKDHGQDFSASVDARLDDER